jgi:hypothetical protein
VAELIPEIAILTNASGVVAANVNESWLLRGLARQLRGWLDKMNVVCVTPKPLCSLTEFDYGVSRRQRISYENSMIAEFATYFGMPELKIVIDPKNKIITSVEVTRDTVCGCASFIAEGLVGASADIAEEKAGLLHHHYPCLATMGIDLDFGDTLIHVSGNILKGKISGQVKSFKQIQYISPDTRSKLPS